MNTPAHLSIGAAVTLGVCAAASVSPVFAAGAGLVSLVGSRAPDWDIKLEKVRRRVAPVWLLGRPFRHFMVLHRGPTHWPLWAPVAASATMLVGLVSTLALGIVVGVLMAADRCLLGDPRRVTFPLRMLVAGGTGYLLATMVPLGAAALGIGVGWLMHILADACTIRGAPLRGRPFTQPMRKRMMTRRNRHLLPPFVCARISHGGDRFIGALAVLAAVVFVALLLPMSYNP